MSYGSFQVLFGVDVTVGGGEIVALLGTNGAGKSTFLNSLGGVLPSKAGQVVFDGVDITDMPAEQVADWASRSCPAVGASSRPSPWPRTSAWPAG